MNTKHTYFNQRLGAACSALVVGSLTMWAADQNEAPTSPGASGHTEVLEGKLMALSEYLHSAPRPNVLESKERGTASRSSSSAQAPTPGQPQTDKKADRPARAAEGQTGQGQIGQDRAPQGSAATGLAGTDESRTTDAIKSHRHNIEGQPLVLVVDRAANPAGTPSATTDPAGRDGGTAGRTATSTGSPSPGNRIATPGTPVAMMAGEAYVLCFATEQDLEKAQQMLKPPGVNSPGSRSTSSLEPARGTAPGRSEPDSERVKAGEVKQDRGAITAQEAPAAGFPADRVRLGDSKRVRVTGTLVQRGSIKAVLVSDISPAPNTAGL